MNTAGPFLIYGLPIFLVGMVALMVFMVMGHDREDPGPGKRAEAVAEAPAAEETPAVAETAAASEEPEAAAGEKTPATAESSPAVAAAGGPPEGIDQATWDLGKQAFATCAACHGPDGTGLKVGPALMAPTFVGSETLLGDVDRPILVVLKGILKESADYMGAMAPLGALPDDQIAAVLTYVRNSWGNSAPPVTVEDVAAARAKFADVDAPAGVKRAEIDAIIAAHQ